MVAGMAVRVAIVTVLFALLSFAVGLFLGIVGVVGINLVTGGHHDITVAYRIVAFPVGLAGMVCAFVGMIGLEIRQRRKEQSDWE